MSTINVRSAVFVIVTALFSEGSKATAWADTDPCLSQTPAAIQGTIDAIARSRAQAELDVAAYGTTGAYASAARDNLAFLREAEGTMTYLLSWLPANSYVPPYSSANAAYNIHGYARMTIISLLYAQHWATISTVYHGSIPARASYDLTASALNLVNALGADAGRCYMRAYHF